MKIIRQSVQALKNPLRALDYNTSSCLCVLFIAASLLWEHILDHSAYVYYKEYDFIAVTSLATLVFLRAMVKGIDKWFLLFFLSLAYIAVVHYRDTANHVFLALFLLMPMAFFPHKHGTDTYSDFIRRALGIVMVVAATQKLISGNFLDGSFMQYFVAGNDLSQQVVGSVCFGQPAFECDALIYVSILSVIWQYVIGILLLINCRHILAFAGELLFVLGIGFAADEMNFQTINIAALLIAFRISAAPLVFLGLLALIIIDTFLVNTILDALL